MKRLLIALALVGAWTASAYAQASCHVFGNNCEVRYPTQVAQCKASTNKCVAQCKNGKSKWWGFNTGTNFDASC